MLPKWCDRIPVTNRAEPPLATLIGHTRGIGRSDRLKLPAPTLTSHLNILWYAGLVRDVREGRSIRCRADYARMNALLGFLTDNCCGSDAACRAPVGVPRPKRRSPR